MQVNSYNYNKNQVAFGNSVAQEQPSPKKEAVFYKLYADIHNDCCKIDPESVPRQVISRALESDIVIIGQAPGASTQRLSGIPYVKFDGNLSTTGKFLVNNLLGLFDYTLNSDDKKRKLVYSTDMVQFFPGKNKNGNGDIKPKQEDIRKSIKWLKTELQNLHPKVIILLGKVAEAAFLKEFKNNITVIKKETGEQEVKLTLEQDKKLLKEADLIFLPHPSSANYGTRSIEKAKSAYEKAAKIINSKLQIHC